MPLSSAQREIVTRSEDGVELHDLLSGLVFLGGAAVYALLQGPGGADFTLTPLSFGVLAIAAGLLNSHRRPLGAGLVLVGWGAAVLAVDHGLIPVERTTPAYMLGVAVGLLAAAFLARRDRRGDWLTSGAMAAFAGPLGVYLSYDVAAFGRWPVWAAAMVAAGGWELFWSLKPGRQSA